VLVLEKGVLGFDGPVDEGIRYLHYDDEDADETVAEDDADVDEELGADV
jgi:ABC-2 type transport system ATP-binding protein